MEWVGGGKALFFATWDKQIKVIWLHLNAHNKIY